MIVPGDDLELLRGATLDYNDNQGLVIRNPNRPAAPTVEGLTSDDALSAEIEAMITGEVNPALAAHGGFVSYVGHDGEGTAYLTMGGGCHGCSMSKMTMLDGVQTMLSEAIEGSPTRQGSHRPHHRREPVLQLSPVVRPKPFHRCGRRGFACNASRARQRRSLICRYVDGRAIAALSIPDRILHPDHRRLLVVVEP